MNLFPRLRTPLSFIASLIASHCAFQAVRAEDTNKSNLRSGVNFQLKTAVDLKVLGRSATHDLNLGESPALFVKALWKQLTGKLPDPDLVREYADKLGTPSFPRRIDLGILLAERAGIRPRWAYSDPWRTQLVLRPNTVRKISRDVGAVFMFFFTSPKGPNGGPGWANNHVPGMKGPASIYGIGSAEANNAKGGLYHPDNSGFWYREFRDSRYAGLDFLLLNVCGPDLTPVSIAARHSALERLRKDDGANVIRLGLFDDTWTWGQPWFGSFWEQKPDCLKVDETSRILYEAKWKPFFESLPREHWYLVENRPMIYFYNSNTLQNRENFHRVLPKMKELFRKDFGVTPWVAVDTAFNYRPEMKEVSESHFKWYTFNLESKYASETRGGLTLSHAMVRWDALSRDNDRKERSATESDLIVKGDRILRQVLNQTHDSDILVLATWNDLGEGTGLNRCYDYYWNGAWKAPNHFMDLIQQSQSGELLPFPEH